MTERAQAKYQLPDKTVAALKELGLGRATARTLATIRCATCPLAKDEPFYANRATRCAVLPTGSVVPIVNRLNQSGILENRRREDINPKVEGRAARVLYDIGEPAKKILHNTEPLPGCQNSVPLEVGKDELTNRTLKDLRNEKGLTQKEVAQILGISQAQVSEIEKTNMNNLTIKRVTEYIAALGGKVVVDFTNDQPKNN